MAPQLCQFYVPGQPRVMCRYGKLVLCAGTVSLYCVSVITVSLYCVSVRLACVVCRYGKLVLRVGAAGGMAWLINALRIGAASWSCVSVW